MILIRRNCCRGRPIFRSEEIGTIHPPFRRPSVNRHHKPVERRSHLASQFCAPTSSPGRTSSRPNPRNNTYSAVHRPTPHSPSRKLTASSFVESLAFENRGVGRQCLGSWKARVF